MALKSAMRVLIRRDPEDVKLISDKTSAKNIIGNKEMEDGGALSPVQTGSGGEDIEENVLPDATASADIATAKANNHRDGKGGEIIENNDVDIDDDDGEWEESSSESSDGMASKWIDGDSSLETVNREKDVEEESLTEATSSAEIATEAKAATETHKDDKVGETIEESDVEMDYDDGEWEKSSPLSDGMTSKLIDRDSSPDQDGSESSEINDGDDGWDGPGGGDNGRGDDPIVHGERSGGIVWGAPTVGRAEDEGWSQQQHLTLAGNAERSGSGPNASSSPNSALRSSSLMCTKLFGIDSIDCKVMNSMNMHPLGTIVFFLTMAAFCILYCCRRKGNLGDYSYFYDRDGRGEYMAVELLEGNFDDNMTTSSYGERTYNDEPFGSEEELFGEEEPIRDEDHGKEIEEVMDEWNATAGEPSSMGDMVVPSGVGDDLDDVERGKMPGAELLQGTTLETTEMSSEDIKEQEETNTVLCSP